MYWCQTPDAAHLTKPDIVLQRYDPLYRASAAHFAGLRARYGVPIIALSLVKQVRGWSGRGMARCQARCQQDLNAGLDY